MILDKLLLFSRGHAGKGVIFTLEISFELGKSINDFLLNFSSLLSGDSSTEGIVSKVSSDSDSSRVDHSILIGGEFGALQFSVVHVTNVLVIDSMSVINLDDLIEKRSESIERIVGSSVNTNT